MKVLIDKIPKEPHAFPVLMESLNGNLIVLFSSRFRGIVMKVSGTLADYWSVGHKITTLDSKCFVVFNGSVTISNK